MCHTHQVLTTTGCPLFWLATTLFFICIFFLIGKKKTLLKLCICVGIWMPAKARRGHSIPGAVVTHGCELPLVDGGN